ncbi:hypothetical protein [Arthrobacter castelli]|uniref:hypothetical protein n=1 Tax=Arthrobacter castelli TaxID=271431 RepID=UPI0012DFAD16|nr:hypothetical protein [Arthrobacter castelli]
MEHKLRVLVRFNTDLNCAAIEVRGCLTRPGCSALLPVIRRARSLSGGMRVVVNLRKARHIDDSALERLRFLCAEEPHRPEDAAQIETPAVLPECPAVRVLHNSDAARLAFFQRSPSALGGEPAPHGAPIPDGTAEQPHPLEAAGAAPVKLLP